MYSSMRIRGQTVPFVVGECYCSILCNFYSSIIVPLYASSKILEKKNGKNQYEKIIEEREKRLHLLIM
jgi:hypothetical protein